MRRWERKEGRKEEKRRQRTNLNKALLSSNPLARAKTASLPPSFLKANIALYLSNKLKFEFNKVNFNSFIVRVDTFVLEVKGDDDDDEGGAGSIVGNALLGKINGKD